MPLRIIELACSGPSAKAGALAGKLWAGWGHDVVQVVTPQSATEHLTERQAADRRWRDTGKRRVVLDWQADEGRDVLAGWLASADVLLDTSGPNGLAATSWGADDGLRHDYPDLVVARLSPFGQTGPYADYQAEEITLYAATGLMHATGDADRAPLAAGVPVCTDSAGLKTFIAVQMSLYRRGRDGGGDVIDLSMAETAMENVEIALAQWLNNASVACRNGDEHAMVPWRTYDCRDGEAVITSGPMRHWLQGAQLFEAPELMDELASMADRIKQRKRVGDLMTPWLDKTDKQTVFQQGQQAGLAWGYVASLDEALASEQNEARSAFVSQQTERGQTYRMPDAPFHGSRLNWQTRPAPEQSVSPAAVDWPASDRASAPTPADSRAPLAGIRVLDFTHDWAGPHAARVLADYGAEVIKIEYPARLDGMRGGYRDRINNHARFWQLHRNKASIVLDLRDSADHATACRLAGEADLVLENSRPGVMAELGLGHDDLKRLKNDIVMVSMSAFGATGPHAHYAGYGGTIEAVSGLQSLTGYRDDPRTRRVREMDVVNGVFGACAAMAALTHRQQTGEGQWVDLSEQETCIWLAGAAIVDRDLNDRSDVFFGNRHPDHVPQGCYRCAGDDRWVTLSVRDDRDWQALCAAIDAPGWMREASLNTVAARRESQDAIDAVIEQWTASREALEVEQAWQQARLPAAMVRSARDLGEDMHLAARDWFVDVPGARLPGLPFHFARGGGHVASRGPALGQDNARYGVDQAAPTADDLGTAFDNGPIAANG